MKKIHVWLACVCITGILYFIQGCCKEVCVKNDLQLQFIGFDRLDVDSLLLIKYEPGGGFANKIDSFYADPLASGASKDTLHGYLSNIDPEKDWEIILPALNSTYRISDIQTTKERCRCGGGSRRIVSGYRLQPGDMIYSNYVEIKK